MSRKQTWPSAPQGVTLLETLLLILFLSIAAVTVLQSVGLCLQTRDLAERRWEEAWERWNQIQEFYRQPETLSSTPIRPLPESRGLALLTLEPLPGSRRPWEVYRALP